MIQSESLHSERNVEPGTPVLAPGQSYRSINRHITSIVLKTGSRATGFWPLGLPFFC
ncbi:MAG: hypothetical protein HC837_00335 [Chloroflexaceae bacterium]|nr:hypothetical protein [Chloroflexaceae bacterium]